MNDNSKVRVAFYFEPNNGQKHAPAGPGWYLLATRGGDGKAYPKEIIPRVRLSNDEGIKLSKVIDKFAEGKPQNPGDGEVEDISLEQAAAEAIDAGLELLRIQLESAEAAVERLANLRRIAEEWGVENE